MKIIVLHGDDTLRSYERLQKFVKAARRRNWEVQRVSDSSFNLSEILVSDSLFQKERLVVVEDSKLIDKTLVKWLQKKADSINVTIVIYGGRTLTKAFIKSLPKIEKVEEFKVPKLIWQFLDSFYPGNVKKILPQLHEIVKKEPVEFVFALLAKLLRDLYWVKVDSKTLTYPSWRIGKLKHQAAKFKKFKLRELISGLASADIKSKTSQSNLLTELDFIIASKLE